MPLKYKFDIIQALKQAGWSSYRIRKEKLLAESTVQKLREREMVSLQNIATICEVLHCQPGDILEYIPDNRFTEREKITI